MKPLWETYRTTIRTEPQEQSAQLWHKVIEAEGSPADYILSDALVEAVRVSLMLRQPLLISGEPGTGKTQLAYSVAWDLGLPPPLRFDTKSTTKASELFYSFDNMGQLRDITMRQPKAVSNYITLGPFGEAILRARHSFEGLEDVAARMHAPDAQNTRSVVLVDEVDKAPRDVPNDLLSEFERMRFRIPELENLEVAADPWQVPVVILTSNSERNLPDAFLRRCAFFDIPFPDDKELESIVAVRLRQFALTQSNLLRDALELFRKLRNRQEIRKPPGTAELINWLIALSNLGVPPDGKLADYAKTVLHTLPILIKNRDDQENAPRVLWKAESTTG